MRTVTLSLLLLVLGCASGSQGLTESQIDSQGPVIVRRKGAKPGGSLEPLPSISQSAAESQLDAARDRFLVGDDEACIQIVDETLKQRPPRGVVEELRRLRYRARRRQIRHHVLGVRILPDRDVVAMGDEIELGLRLENLTAKPLTVPRTYQGSSPTVFDLTIDRQDWDVYGNVSSLSFHVLVRLKADVELSPHGVRSIPYRIPSGPHGHAGFTEFLVSGSLHPAVILSGKHRYYSTLPLDSARIRVLPKGYEPIAKAPLRTMEKAWKLGAREHLLVAAELVPPEERRTAVARLVSFLKEAQRPATVTVMAALRRLTGKSLQMIPREWIRWWNREETSNAFR